MRCQLEPRDGVGQLLAEVQRIKAEGEYDAAKGLFEKYGVHFDPARRDEIVARVDRLRMPSYTGFVQPRLEPVRDAAGAIAAALTFAGVPVPTRFLAKPGHDHPEDERVVEAHEGYVVTEKVGESCLPAILFDPRKPARTRSEPAGRVGTVR